MNTKKITIYFIRHGETYLNKYKRMQGWADSPLTREGEAVAKKAGEILANIEFDGVYSSDLGRTIQTARIILKENQYASKLKIQPKKEFRESFFGYFEGATQDESYQAFADVAGVSKEELFQKFSLSEFMELVKRADPYHEAENYEELWERLSKGIENIVHVEYDKEEVKILVVTHGNVIRNIFTRMDATISPATDIQNSSISTLVYENGKYLVSGFNQSQI
jgi:probable phosphoglycerate mutase